MKDTQRNLSEIVNRNKAFFNRTNSERPLLGIYILGLDFMQAYKETSKNIPRDRQVKPDDIVTEALIKDIDNFIDLHEEFEDDIFYSVQPYLFIPWMEAITGCPIYAGKDSFYAKPFLKSIKEFSEEVDLSGNNIWLNKLLEIKKALVDHLGDSYPICSSTHLRGPADMVSAAIGQTQFCLEFYDNPEELKKMSRVFTDVFIKVAEMENKISAGSKFGGYVVNTFGIWTEKVCQFFQDDAVAFISPKIFREFFLDDHLRIDSSFSSTFYHLHPISMFMIDELVNYPKLKIVEINREPEVIGPSMEEMVPSFKKLQDSNKSIFVHFAYPDLDLDLLEKELNITKNNLSNNGMCVNICVKDVDDGLKKMKLLRKVFKV